MVYDAYSRPVTTTDARLGVTRRAFDLVGNLSELEDAEGNLTRWLYDRLDRPVEEVNELGLSREWVWSHAADTLLRETDRNGNVREFDFDNLYRMTAEHWVAAGASPSVTVTTTTQGAPDVNERQRITLPAPAGGTWTITFAGQTTAALAWDATAAQVQAALESLSNIGAGNVAVVGAGSSGNPFSVTFQGALATTDVSQLTADGSNLSGALVGTVSVQTGGSDGNEVQQVEYVPDKRGTIAYKWADTAVPQGSTALEFQEILEDLSTIGPGNVSVSGAWPTYTVTFVGDLAGQNVESLEGWNAQITTHIEGGTPANEVQSVTLPAERTGGTFTLAFEGQVTSALASAATAAAVDSALEALSTIGAGNVAVTGVDGGPYTVTFQSALGQQDVALLVLNAAGLTGGTIATATDQQGQAGTNEVQQVTVQNATDGSFKLRFSGEWTDAIGFDATATAVEAALEALSAIDDVSVTGAAGGPYTVNFLGALTKSDVVQMSGDSSGLHQPLNSIDFAYDAADQLLSAQDDWSRYAWQYDGLGRVTSVDNAGTPGAPHVVLASAWDGLSRRTSLSATIDGVADLKNTYAYDTLSRMTHVEQRGQPGGNVVADKGVDFAYNPLGQFTSIVRYTDLAQGPAVDVATSAFTWDAMGRLEALDHTHGGSVITGYAWQFDGLNRVTQYSSTRDGTSLYSYDTTSQLVSADHSFQADEAFTWDLTGNRTDTGYQTGANNRLLSDGVFNYTYTGEGGLATRTRISTDPADDHRVEYGWDHRRRLVSAVYKNNSGAVTKRVEIDYDMFDRRIAKRVDSNGDGSFDRFERWVYDGDDVLLDFLDIDGQGPAPLSLPTFFRGRGGRPPGLPADLAARFVRC